jgi:hypothetical protein
VVVRFVGRDELVVVVTPDVDKTAAVDTGSFVAVTPEVDVEVEVGTGDFDVDEHAASSRDAPLARITIRRVFTPIVDDHMYPACRSVLATTPSGSD